jgi:hypothetical protein
MNYRKKSMFQIVVTSLTMAGFLLATSVLAEVRVQIVHAAPFADSLEGTSVTVTVNGAPVLENFLFKDFTDYLELPAGDYDLAVIPTGASDPAIEASVTLDAGTDYTVIAVGDGVNQDLALWPLVDNVDASGSGSLNIRIVHAAPFAADLADTEVSIRTAEGVVVNDLVGVPYFAQSGFFPIPAGNYDLKVASNDGQTNLIDPLAADLPAGVNLTVIAIGDGVNQPLGILALPVGELATRAPVDSSVNGWWFGANTQNEGFLLQPIPAQNRLVGMIYSWDPAGSGDTFWLTLDGSFDGRSSNAVVFAGSGGQFAGDVPADLTEVGTVEFDFVDCNTASATLVLDDGTDFTWELGRLTQSVPCTLD